jgi:hypothetical protein
LRLAAVAIATKSLSSAAEYMARTYGIDQRRSAADTTSSMRCGANRVGHDNLKQTRTQSAKALAI